MSWDPPARGLLVSILISMAGFKPPESLVKSWMMAVQRAEAPAGLGRALRGVETWQLPLLPMGLGSRWTRLGPRAPL